MGLPVRIRDLAEDLIKLSGFALSEIPIVYTALRPGEKLEEALWEQGAHVEPTSEADILCVSERAASAEVSFGQILQRLRTAVEVGDRLSIRAALADAIPTFVPHLGDAEAHSQSISLRSN